MRLHAVWSWPAPLPGEHVRRAGGRPRAGDRLPALQSRAGVRPGTGPGPFDNTPAPGRPQPDRPPAELSASSPAGRLGALASALGIGLLACAPVGGSTPANTGKTQAVRYVDSRYHYRIDAPGQMVALADGTAHGPARAGPRRRGGVRLHHHQLPPGLGPGVDHSPRPPGREVRLPLRAAPPWSGFATTCPGTLRRRP